MTTRPGASQTTFNSGELDPAALRSTQLKPYYAAAARMERLRPVPQGGVTLMPGSRHLHVLAATSGQSVRLLPFQWSRERAYMMALRAGAIDIFHAATGGYAFSATVAVPFADTDVIDVTFARLDDTLILFHPDHPPRRVRRLGVDSWSSDDAPFTDLPLVDYGGAYAGRAEVWRMIITFPSGFTFGTQQFELTASGEPTTLFPMEIVDGAVDSAAIVAALEALPSVGAGVTAVYSGAPADNTHSYDITFGGTNAGGNFEMTGRCVSSASVAASFSRIVAGEPGGEPIMSASRGWPSCGAFVQGRLMLAGFRSEPAALVMSRVGEYFDLNVKATAASGPILVRMDLDGGERIQSLRRGKHLCIFTTRGEWFVPDRAIARGQPFNMARSSDVGTRRGAPVIEQEGDLLFCNPAGTKIFAAAYSDTSQGYQPSPISLLASHLVRAVVGMALQTSDASTDSDRLWIVNADGGLVCGHLLRNQDVVGFTPWTGPDPVRAVAVDAQGVVWIVAERSGQMRIEILEEGLVFDAARTGAAPAGVLSGLAHLEGRQVWALADGWPAGPLTVAGGQITLPGGAATSATAGLWTPFRLDPLPMPRDIAERRVLLRPARVHGVRVDVSGSTEIAIGANGGPVREIPLARFGDLADQPPQPFTGQIHVTGLTRYTPDTQVTITQKTPGPFTLRQLTLEARI